MCLKLLVRTPRGPVIFTTRDLSSHVTLSGILTTALLLMVFMAWVLAHWSYEGGRACGPH